MGFGGPLSFCLFLSFDLPGVVFEQDRFKVKDFVIEWRVLSEPS